MEEHIERNAYLAELRNRAKRLQTDLQDLEEQVRKGPEEAKARFASLKEAVEEKRAVFMGRLEDARDRGEAAWSQLKTGVEGAWEELKEASQRAKDEVQD